MAGTFILGETKVRPGTYFNIQKKGGNAATGVMNGVTAVIFRADLVLSMRQSNYLQRMATKEHSVPHLLRTQ